MGGTAAAAVTLGAYAYGGAPLALKAATGAHQMMFTHRVEDNCMHESPTQGRRARWARALPYTYADTNGRLPYQQAAALP